MQRVVVGEPFTLLKGKVPSNYEGSILEVLQNGDGIMLALFMPEMTHKEIQQIQYEKVKVRTIREDSFLLGMVRFGSSKLLYQVVFDPTLYGDGRALEFLKKTNMLTLYAIDPAADVVKVIRVMSVPPKLMKQWEDAWGQADTRPDFSDRYKRWVHDLNTRYPLLKLWDYGVYIGQLGE